MKQVLESETEPKARVGWAARLVGRLHVPTAGIRAYNFARHGLRFGLPTIIGIEIATACNRRCHYCPVSIDPMKQEIISEEMWALFKSRLREYRWRGILGMARYNELSLVPKSERYVRELVELGCLPLIPSNGDKPDVVRKWCEAGAKRIEITQHPPDKDGWLDAIAEVQKEHPKIIRIRRIEPDVLHNQAGMVPAQTNPRTHACLSVLGLTVDVYGDALLCCLDYYRKHQYGNIKDKSLEQIWTDLNYVKVRKLIGERKPGAALCKGCSEL